MKWQKEKIPHPQMLKYASIDVARVLSLFAFAFEGCFGNVPPRLSGVQPPPDLAASERLAPPASHSCQECLINTLRAASPWAFITEIFLPETSRSVPRGILSNFLNRVPGVPRSLSIISMHGVQSFAAASRGRQT